MTAVGSDTEFADYGLEPHSQCDNSKAKFMPQTVRIPQAAFPFQPLGVTGSIAPDMRGIAHLLLQRANLHCGVTAFMLSGSTLLRQAPLGPLRFVAFANRSYFRASL